MVIAQYIRYLLDFLFYTYIYPIDYVIACNDDALKSIKLILQAISTAIIERKSEMQIHVVKGVADEDMSSAEEEKE